MATIKMLNENGVWEFVQLAGEDVASLREDVDANTTALAEKAKLKGTLNLDDYDSFKIVASGGYDYQPAIQQACNDLVSKYGGGVLILPPGTFDRYSAYSLPNNVSMIGTGYYQTILNSKSDTPAITLNDNSCLMNVKIVNTFSTVRGTSNLNAAVLVYGDKVLVENVWITGSKTVGIMVSTASDIIINKCIVENTLADGIHITDNSKNVWVDKCIVRESGDDSFAVVSYQNQTNQCQNIFITNNYTYHSKSRGVAVVGGYIVTVANNTIDTPCAAGVYIAQETAYSTLGDDEIDIFDNRIYNANSYNPTTTYGAIHVSCQDVNYPIKNVRIFRNKMVNSRWRGISLGGTGTTTNLLQNVLVKDNKILGNTIEAGIAFNNVQDLIIERNTLRNITASGMYDNAYNSGILSIKNNKVENANTSVAANQFGIIVRSSGLSLAEVTDNKVIDNGNLNRTIQILNGTPFIYERNVYPGTQKTASVTDLTTLVPVYIGQLAVKGTLVYIATGTSATTDWKQLN